MTSPRPECNRSSLLSVRLIVKGCTKPLAESDVGVMLQAFAEEALIISKLQMVADLSTHGEVGRGRDRVDIVISTDGGNSQSYLLRRLKRDTGDQITGSSEVRVSGGEIHCT